MDKYGIYISTILFASILGITIYLTNVKLTNNNITSFVITIGAIFLLRDYIAARAQLVTFILFVLELYFIEQFLRTKYKRYVIGLIIIPIMLANLHVAVFPFYFILYLPYLGEYFICIMSNLEVYKIRSKIKKLHEKLKNCNAEEKINIREQIYKLIDRKKVLKKRAKNNREKAYKIKIEKNNNIKALIIVLLICLLTGFLTPLGTTPYTYLVKTMQGNTTHNISEHLPLTLVQNVFFMCTLLIFIIILMFTDTKIRLSDLFMLGGLILLTFYTRRQESMFIIAGCFILNRLVCSMFEKYDKGGPNKIEEKMTDVFGIITTICIVLSISIVNYKPKIDDSFINEKDYPVMAADYILHHLDIKNIRLYNEYNYGSYLLFRGIPVFIDSRADLYSPEFNEGVNVFSDFLNISDLEVDNMEEMFDKYQFTHLIMYKKSKLGKFLSQNPEKYEQLYEDNNFRIFERK